MQRPLESQCSGGCVEFSNYCFFSNRSVGRQESKLVSVPHLVWVVAATQVDVHRRLLVADVSPDNDAPHVFINPVIIEKDGVTVTEEGCLSVPGYYEEVERAEHIKVRYLDRDGAEREDELEGLLAVCVQHEIDHLDGKLFVDYLSEAKRQRIRKKLEKDRRHQSAAVAI